MYHVEAKEAVAEEHLDLVIVGGEITVGVAASVLVYPAPLVARRSQLVCSQRARSRREAARQHYAFLPVPLLVVLQYPRMHS